VQRGSENKAICIAYEFGKEHFSNGLTKILRGQNFQKRFEGNPVLMGKPKWYKLMGTKSYSH